MKSFKGLATGVGSLPYRDAEEAIKLIFKYIPQAPFWPQLPKRDMREGMVAQFSENLPCLKIKEGKLIFDASSQDQELEVFYEKVIFADTEHFRVSEGFACGLHKFHQYLQSADLSKVEFIKVHITGPFTFCAGINNEQGNPLLHDEVLLQAMIKGLGMKALWQIETFKKFGKKIIIFIDEPYLSTVGSAYCALNRDEAIKNLSEMTEIIKNQDCLIGVHCCGNTDWAMLMEVKGIDIINFDAFNFQERFILYANNLKAFIKRGGIICWGIVPTQGEAALGKLTPDILAQKINSGINILVKKGLDRALLLDRLTISPACGLGSLNTEGSAAIFKLLAETSDFIKTNL